MTKALGEACHSCGLFRAHAGPNIIQLMEDRRPEKYAKRILVITSAPSVVEAYNQMFFSDDGSWVLDYLNNLEFSWAVTSVILCNPPQDERGYTIKVDPKLYNHCSGNYLMPLIKQYEPDAILTLGGEALTACWPASRGKAPSISKARMAPVRLDDLPGAPWLIATYSHRQHEYWISSDGRKGQDLTDEYCRVFSLLADTVVSGFQVLHPEWKLISTTADLENLVKYYARCSVREQFLDTENATWIGRNLRPNAIDPDGVLPSRLTPWHEDNELLCVGTTVWADNDYRTFVVTLDHCDDPTWMKWFLELMKIPIWAWNDIADLQDLFIFLDIPHPPIAGDGFLLRGLRDSSLTDNNLKTTAGELLTVPDWSDELDKHLLLARAARSKQGDPPVSCMLDLPKEIYLDYNAHDTLYLAVLIREHLTQEKLGEGFPWHAYQCLLDGLPWLMEMERNGVPVCEDTLNLTLDELEAEEASLLAELRSHPSVKRAEFQATVLKREKTRSAKAVEFNVRSPIFFKELVRDMYGVPNGTGGYDIPDWFPTTPKSGQLVVDKVVLASLAGNEIKDFTPVEEKDEKQLFWHKVAIWKETGDDFTKLLGLLDYVVDGVIHARCRILRTDMSDDGEEGGGAVSGRFAFSPNIQNFKKIERFLRNFRAPKGWTWVRFDYGRIELAWLAFNTQDPLMLQWAMEGKDAHRERGAALWAKTFSRPVEEFDHIDAPTQDFWRSKGKTQNFATVYLEEPETTAGKTGATLEEVLEDLATADAVHPALFALKKEIYNLCQSGGYIYSSLFGRRRTAVGWLQSTQTAEEFFSLDPVHRKERNHRNLDIYRSLWNTRAAQADASDTTFETGKYIHNLLEGGNWLDKGKVKSIGFIHDSLDFLVKDEYLSTAKPALHQAVREAPSKMVLANGKKFTLPLPVDAQEGHTLADFLKK